jgi:hypothetical protein
VIQMHLRRPLGMMAGLVLALASAVPALAEDTPAPTDAPPPGVVFDGTLTVTFLRELTDEPIAEAFVELTPRRAGEAMPGYGEWTGEDGSATFTELPRPEDGAEAIEWQLSAHWEIVSYPNNCIQAVSTDGSENVDAAAEATVTIHSHGSASSIRCGPDISGSVTDADGQPFAVEQAQLVAVSEDGHEWQTAFEVAADGTFLVSAPPVETAHLTVLGGITRTAVVDGCTYSYAWTVDEDVDLTAEVEGQVFVDLVASEEPILGSCEATPQPSDDAPAPTDAVATPPQTGNQPGDEPAITPPATDATTDPATTAARPLPQILFGILLAGLVVLTTSPRFARRAARR